LAAAVIGLSLLGEGLHGGALGVLLALAGAGLASWGVVLLTRVTPENHPVAAVLALEPESASPEPALAPAPPSPDPALVIRQPDQGHLTPL
jgi:hypothetical protein